MIGKKIIRDQESTKMNIEKEMLVLSHLKHFPNDHTRSYKVYANDDLVEMTMLTLDEIHGLSSMIRETDYRALKVFFISVGNRKCV